MTWIKTIYLSRYRIKRGLGLEFTLRISTTGLIAIDARAQEMIRHRQRALGAKSFRIDAYKVDLRRRPLHGQNRCSKCERLTLIDLKVTRHKRTIGTLCINRACRRVQIDWQLVERWKLNALPPTIRRQLVRNVPRNGHGSAKP